MKCMDCAYNDDGLCDKKGVFVKDGNSCKEVISDEKVIKAINTIKQYCRSKGEICQGCILKPNFCNNFKKFPKYW